MFNDKTQKHNDDKIPHVPAKTKLALSGVFLALIKRFRALEAAQRDLDFNMSQWARDLRACFESGKPGDNAFVKWCETELSLTEGKARHDLLVRAAAADAVKDIDTWNTVGGFKTIRALTELPRKEQVACLGAVKASGYSLRTVLKERGHGPAPIAPGSGPATPIQKRAPSAPPAAIADSVAKADAAELAAYIATCTAANGWVLPRAIARILKRYTTSALRAVA